MVSYIKALVVLSVSKLVGELVTSSFGCIFGNAYNPVPLSVHAPPEAAFTEHHSEPVVIDDDVFYDAQETLEPPTKVAEGSDAKTGTHYGFPKEQSTSAPFDEITQEHPVGKMEYSSKTVFVPRKSILKIPRVEGQPPLEEVLKKRVTFQESVLDPHKPRVVGCQLKKKPSPEPLTTFSTKPPTGDSTVHAPEKASVTTSTFHASLIPTGKSGIPPPPPLPVVTSKLHATLVPSDKSKKSRGVPPQVPVRTSSLSGTVSEVSADSEGSSSDKKREEPVYATILPRSERPTTRPTVKIPSFSTFGYFAEESDSDDDTYEEVRTGAFVDEHTPAGYSEHFYANPYDTPKFVKSVYQEFKDTSRDKFESLKESTKGSLELASKGVKGAANKAKKGTIKVASQIKEQSCKARSLARDSADRAKEGIHGTASKLAREASSLGTRVHHSVKPKVSQLAESTSASVRGVASKTKREATKLGSEVREMGQELKSEAGSLSKKTKSRLQGATHKTAKELGKFGRGLKITASETKGSMTRFFRNKFGNLVTDEEISRL